MNKYVRPPRRHPPHRRPRHPRVCVCSPGEGSWRRTQRHRCCAPVVGRSAALRCRRAGGAGVGGEGADATVELAAAAAAVAPPPRRRRRFPVVSGGRCAAEGQGGAAGRSGATAAAAAATSPSRRTRVLPSPSTTAPGGGAQPATGGEEQGRATGREEKGRWRAGGSSRGTGSRSYTTCHSGIISSPCASSSHVSSGMSPTFEPSADSGGPRSRASTSIGSSVSRRCFAAARRALRAAAFVRGVVSATPAAGVAG